jgi:hypothetical protein
VLCCAVISSIERTREAMTGKTTVSASAIVRKLAVVSLMALCLSVGSANAAQELTEKTFQELMKSGRNGMVKFYQPVCATCAHVVIVLV